MQIKKLLTPYNYSTGTADRIKYIVIHYVGALGGAEANCKYYASQYIGASAHYYVGFDGEVWQSVEEKDIAWHCGAKTYIHPECRNANSLGIEMCVRNSSGNLADTSRDWYFEDATVRAAIELTKELMAKYNIPADRVIRHHDVTGKICPNPYVYNQTQHTWDAFKAALVSAPVKKSGWKQEDEGWRFYNGDTGECVRNNWHHDLEKDLWYWFDGAGIMITNKWYKYKGGWYFLNADGVMLKGTLIAESGKVYCLDSEGKMATEPVTLMPDQDGALWYNSMCEPHQKNLAPNRTMLKCGNSGSVVLPDNTKAGVSFTLTTLSIDAKDFRNPCIKFEFTSDITSTANALTLNFQIFKICKGQVHPIPVGPVWTFSRLKAINASDTFSFFACDCDICDDECCTYSVVTTVVRIASEPHDPSVPVIPIRAITSINNASLSAIIIDNTNDCKNR